MSSINLFGFILREQFIYLLLINSGNETKCSKDFSEAMDNEHFL